MILGEAEEGETVKYVGSVAKAITAGDIHLAEDLAQDVLLIALVNSPQDEGRRRRWLRSITKNTLKYSRFRKANGPRHWTNSEVDFERIDGREPDPAQLLTQAAIKSRLDKMLLALPEGHQQIVRMRAIEELPPREVASRLGLSVETVRSTYRRSLASMRQGVDREVGEDALSAWPSRALVGLIWPKRLVLSVVGLVSVLLVAGAVLWGGGPEPDAIETLSRIDGVAESAGVSTPVDLGSLVAEQRAPAVVEAASADLVLADIKGRLVPNEEVILRGAASEVVPGYTDADGTLSLAGLEPGPWTAWHRGERIDSKVLASGANSWALQVELDLELRVRVVDIQGHSAPGIEVYRLDDATNRVELLGETDAAGRLEARVPIAGSWIAARGLAGAASKARYLDQPAIQAEGGAVQLVLRDVTVSWHQIRFDEGVSVDARTIVARHAKPSTTTSQLIKSGIQQASSWLPPWRRADGAYGVQPGPGVAFAALDAEGEPWWISRHSRVMDRHESTLEALPPFTVVGQLIDQNERPLPDRTVMVVGGAMDGMTTLRCTSDADGRFEIAGCPSDQVRLNCEFGKHMLAKRPADGGVVDVGTWKLVHRTLDVEAVGSPGPWGCTIFKGRIRRSLPESNPSLAGWTVRFVASQATAHCVVEIPHSAMGGAVLVEAGSGKGARAVFVKRPEGGWTEDKLRVDLTHAHAVRLQAQFPKERFPVRAVWVEENFDWTSSAHADPASGMIRSAALPAGRWSLKVVDRYSLSAKSGIVAVGAGSQYDFGRVAPKTGQLRIAIPSSDHGTPSRGGVIRARKMRSSETAFVFVESGELTPYQVTTELPVGEYRVSVTVEGEYAAIGEVIVEERFIADVALSREHVFVGFENGGARGMAASGASLKLVDLDGRELWSSPVPSGDLTLAEDRFVVVPRISGARLLTESPDGLVVADLASFSRIGSKASTVWFSFEEWSGVKE